VTLLLRGGHVVTLGGVACLDELVELFQEPQLAGGTVDFRSETMDRLVIRRDALVGLLEGFGGNERKAFPPGATDSSSFAKPFVLFENFLQPEDHRAVVARTLQMESNFEPSKVTSGRDDYRKSVLLTEDEVIGPMFRQRIKKVAVEAGLSLGVQLGNIPAEDQIECQVTAHLSGGFFQIHKDNGCSSTASRLLSYVYYFRARPNGFLGGELKLYNSRAEHCVDVVGHTFFLIEPKDNSLILFPSRIWHEVLPTYVPSGAFCDSRFTVNGWIR